MVNNGLTCELCRDTGGRVLWASPNCRVVRVADADYPGFCRVIWTAHVREMSDLAVAERQLLMDIVFTVEQVIRALFSPDKINLASFGNLTPHIHWHVIPRWHDDRHFPEPIWGRIHQTSPVLRPAVSDEALMGALSHQLSAGVASD